MTRKKKPISKLSKREEDFAIREQQLAQRAENIFRLSSPFAGQTQAYYNFQKSHGAPSNGLSTYSEIFRNNYPVQQITAPQNIREAVSRETQTIPQSGNISVGSQPSNGLSAFATNQRRPRSNEDISVDLTENQTPLNLVPNSFLRERENQARQRRLSGTGTNIGGYRIDNIDRTSESEEKDNRELVRHTPQRRDVSVSAMTPPPLPQRILTDVELARSFLFANIHQLPFSSQLSNEREWRDRIHSYRDERAIIRRYISVRQYFSTNHITPIYPEGTTERTFGHLYQMPTQSESIGRVLERETEQLQNEEIITETSVLYPLQQEVNRLASVANEIRQATERNPQGSTGSRNIENENEEEDEEKIEERMGFQTY